MLFRSLMFVGAGPAGTGGGVKITTAAVVVMTIVSVMSGEEDAIIHRRRVEPQTVYRALTLITMGLLIVAVSTVAIWFSLGGTFTLTDVLFEETSAFATVGLSVGVSGAGLLSLALAIAMKSGSSKEVLPSARIIIG